MRRTIGFLWLLVLALALPQSSHQLWAQNDKEKKDAPPVTTLKVGDEAPDFELPDNVTGAKVKLSSFRGKKNVVVAFYYFAFTDG